MSFATNCGFLLSFWLFHEYSSNSPINAYEKKYPSYEVLKNDVFESIKKGDGDEMQQAGLKYLHSLRR